jgi:hypothetical protein
MRRTARDMELHEAVEGLGGAEGTKFDKNPQSGCLTVI